MLMKLTDHKTQKEFWVSFGNIASMAAKTDKDGSSYTQIVAFAGDYMVSESPEHINMLQAQIELTTAKLWYNPYEAGYSPKDFLDAASSLKDPPKLPKARKFDVIGD